MRLLDLSLPQVAALLARELRNPAWNDARRAGRMRFYPSLSFGRHCGPPLAAARRAAVMLLLERGDDDWYVPLTVRPDFLPDHPGQISLPGGRLEAGETWEQAAVREFCEELGVQSFPGNVVGPLQHIYVYNSNFEVAPYVAVVDHCPPYQPNSDEVARLIRLPFSQLGNAAHSPQRSFKRGRVAWQARVIDFSGDAIWGATAIILGELHALLDQILQAGPRD